MLQVSALEQDVIEVDSDTKEMLKSLVCDCRLITRHFFFTFLPLPPPQKDFGNINVQITAPATGGAGTGPARNRPA